MKIMSARRATFHALVLQMAMFEVSSAEYLQIWARDGEGCVGVPNLAVKIADGKYGLTAAMLLRAGGFEGNDPRNQPVYSEPTTWIEDFCRSPGNEFFAEVPESFIRESMNLIDIGRGVEIPYYKDALGVLLGERSIRASEGQKASILQSSATLLYGLLHARFLVSPQGLKVVLEKFSKADYGRCPRVYCRGQAVLPVGETDRPMQSSVKVFCPRCGDLYFPSGYVRACDGAFWGTSLAHLVLLGWPELKTPPNTNHYVPRVFGFRLHSININSASGGGVERTTNGNNGGLEGDNVDIARDPMRGGV